MNTRSKFLVIIAASLLASGPASAMGIQQFEKMAEDDQHAYIGNLVWGAIRILEEDCKPQLAAQVRKLFLNDVKPAKFIPLEGTESLGYKLIRAGERAAKQPEARRAQVEDAMRATLQEKGITLPDRFVSIGSAFKPKLKRSDDDAGFGSVTSGSDAEAILVIQILQEELDLRNLSEIAAGTRTQGVCKGAVADPKSPPDRLRK